MSHNIFDPLAHRTTIVKLQMEFDDDQSIASCSTVVFCNVTPEPDDDETSGRNEGTLVDFSGNCQTIVCNSYTWELSWFLLVPFVSFFLLKSQP